MTINEFEAAGLIPWLEIRGQHIRFIFIERWPDAAGHKLTAELLADDAARVALRNECIREGRISPRKRHPAPYGG
jgi:hypothetical protein